MFLLLAVLQLASFGAEWAEMARVRSGEKVEIRTRDGVKHAGEFVSATAETVVVRERGGERSIGKAEVQEVRVSDPGRRVRRGLLWTAVGAGAGLGIGWGVCPHCANEGAGGKYTGPGLAIGAGIGALGFLTPPWRTVYRVK